MEKQSASSQETALADSLWSFTLQWLRRQSVVVNKYMNKQSHCPRPHPPLPALFIHHGPHMYIGSGDITHLKKTVRGEEVVKWRRDPSLVLTCYSVWY